MRKGGKIMLFEKFFARFKKKETPDEIFKKLKANKHSVSEKELDDYTANLQILAADFIQTGQTAALDKLAFLMACVEKEKQALAVGINQFVFRDDIDEFLKRRDIEESSIKLIELSDYPRRIPADIQKKIKETKKNILIGMVANFKNDAPAVLTDIVSGSIRKYSDAKIQCILILFFSNARKICTPPNKHFLLNSNLSPQHNNL